MPTSSLDTRACAGRPRLQSGIPGPIADGPSHGRETGAWEGGRDSNMGRKQLPGCYSGEQWSEDLLGEGEPGDGHEASSDAPIEHLAPGVVKQVDPGPRTREVHESQPETGLQEPPRPSTSFPGTCVHPQIGMNSHEHRASDLFSEGSRVGPRQRLSQLKVKTWLTAGTCLLSVQPLNSEFVCKGHL